MFRVCLGGSRVSVKQGAGGTLTISLVPVVFLNHTLAASQNRRMHDGSAVMLAPALEENVYINLSAIRELFSTLGNIQDPCDTH